MKDDQLMKRSALSVAFDTLGILNLLAAAGFLGVFFWSVVPATQAFALRAFTPCFAMTLLFFALGRLVELFELSQTGPIVERRGRDNAQADTQQTKAKANPETGQEQAAGSHSLKLQLIEPTGKGGSKARRDAA